MGVNLGAESTQSRVEVSQGNRQWRIVSLRRRKDSFVLRRDSSIRRTRRMKESITTWTLRNILSLFSDRTRWLSRVDTLEKCRVRWTK